MYSRLLGPSPLFFNLYVPPPAFTRWHEWQWGVRIGISSYNCLPGHICVLWIGVSGGYSHYAQVPYVYSHTSIVIPAILWSSESHDCNKHYYNRQNTFCLCNPKNNCCENMIGCLVQIWAEVSSSVKVSCRFALWSQQLQCWTIQ